MSSGRNIAASGFEISLDRVRGALRGGALGEYVTMGCVTLHMLVLGIIIGLRFLPGEARGDDVVSLEIAVVLVSGSLLCLLHLIDMRSTRPGGAPSKPAPAAASSGPAISDDHAHPSEGHEVDGNWTECAKLMARISHEFRTPLNAIIGFADMMRRELLGPIGHPRYREYVDHIRDSGAGLLKSAEEIMTLTSVAAGSSHASIVPVLLEPLVREACRTVAIIADAKRLRIHVSGIEQRTLWGDRSALQLVISNLVSATVERAAYGATIVVRMAGTLAQPRLEISTSAPLGEPTATTSHGDDIPDLSIAVATCLVRLQGGRLITTNTIDGGWSIRIILPGGGMGMMTSQQTWARAA
jgi:hypothetical protein